MEAAPSSMLRARPTLRRPLSIHWAPYLWLVYLPGVFVAPVVDRSGVAVWMSTIGAVLLVVPLLLYAYALRGERRVERVIALMALIALGLTPINGSAPVFAVYAAALIGMIRPPKRAAAGLALLLFAVTLEAALIHLRLGIWVGETAFVILVAAVNAHFTAVQDIEGDL